MTWSKNRREAFLAAAEIFGTPYNERTRKQKEMTSDGICHAIKTLTGSNKIYRWAYRFREATGILYCYWWGVKCLGDWSYRCDKERSLFCCLMAALSDKEFEALEA